MAPTRGPLGLFDGQPQLTTR